MARRAKVLAALAALFAAWASGRSFAAPDFQEMPGPGILYEVVGEYKLPKPVVLSPHKVPRLQADLGVNVTEVGEDAYMVMPQQSSNLRPFGEVEEMYLRDLRGNTISPEKNPGIRVEPNFVSEEEETEIMDELQELAARYGYNFAADEAASSWRMTGRDEGTNSATLAPWGWGQNFSRSELPEGLLRVVAKLEASSYPLGPLRDVTVNIRSSEDYQMVPHIDPLPDGPNSFVMSLWSSAVVTFSPVASLRREVERANDDGFYAQHSYTDDDIDCLVPRRAIYQFSGNARYLWTHAVRPSLPSGDGTFERWGTWDKVLRRQKDRAAIIFAFADPLEL